MGNKAVPKCVCTQVKETQVTQNKIKTTIMIFVFVVHCLTTKFLIGKLPAAGWV